jgi:hypothetical protein
MKVRTEDPNHPAGLMYIFLEESYLFQAPSSEILCGSTKTLVALCSMQAVYSYGGKKLESLQELTLINGNFLMTML